MSAVRRTHAVSIAMRLRRNVVWQAKTAAV